MHRYTFLYKYSKIGLVLRGKYCCSAPNLSKALEHFNKVKEDSWEVEAYQLSNGIFIYNFEDLDFYDD